MRWCTKQGCTGKMKGKNLSERKLVCPECKTAICFRCREEWHGRWTSCESAMEKRFQGWANLTQNISFCPMCRTKIEKTEGCNHMTCGFCRYEFCWICGNAASSDSQHFSSNPLSFMTGCGAGQMEQNPPGLCVRIWRKIGIFLLGLLLLPFFLIFATPVALCALMYECCCRG